MGVSAAVLRKRVGVLRAARAMLIGDETVVRDGCRVGSAV